MKRGFILVEISVTYVILSLALVTLIPVFLMAIRASKNTEQIVSATYLSSELMEEVLLHKWDQSTSSPAKHIPNPGAIGVDSGETASDKRTFNDIDDFNGWTESPPKDPVMNSLAQFYPYSRSVSVAYADSNLNVSAAATDYKLVTVCTSTKKLKPLCMNTVCTNR